MSRPSRSRSAFSRRSLAVVATVATVAIALATVGAQVDPARGQGGQQQGSMSKLAQNLDARGVALKGYDPVAYFSGAPTRGRTDLSATYDGAIYHFATAANRATFTASPGTYVPQYGGYCAMGVAGNGKFDIDPLAWKVEDGKLYLNKDKRTQTLWLKDVPGHIVKADRNWPTLGAVKK